MSNSDLSSSYLEISNSSKIYENEDDVYEIECILDKRKSLCVEIDWKNKN